VKHRDRGGVSGAIMSERETRVVRGRLLLSLSLAQSAPSLLIFTDVILIHLRSLEYSS